MCLLLTVNVPTFVLSLEPSQTLLALLSVPEFIEFMADDDSLLSQSLSMITFGFAAISSDLSF